MANYFTDRFLNDAPSFAVLHEGLEKRGFVTDADEPYMNRPIHNTLNEERYQKMFETHYAGRHTDVVAGTCAYDIGDGFPSFYVAFDSTQFEDMFALKAHLKRIGVLK